MKTNRKSHIVIGLLIIFAGLSTTLAYFSASKEVRNIITTGSVSLEIIELDEKGEPYPSEGYFSIMPGQEITKDVKVINTGNHPIWLRVDVKKVFANKNLETKLINLNINEKDWAYQDGFFVYRKQLKPLETTESLFDTVFFSPVMGNNYKNELFSINIKAQAVQSEYNGSSINEIKSWK